MQTIGIIAFTKAGCAIAKKLADGLGLGSGSVCGPARFADELGIDAYGSLDVWTQAHFATDDALIFVGASGIAVRAIAPHVRDKFSDPAVVSVDEVGRFVVPLLSGHVGGANELAREVAAITGGQAAVSTATDVNGLFAVDEWAARHGFAILERSIAKEISAALLDGRPVGFKSDFELDEKPSGVTEGAADIGFVVSLDDSAMPFPRTLHLVPRVATVGVGCRKGTDPSALEQAVADALAEANVSAKAVTAIASIDVKKDELAILELASKMGWSPVFYTADELAAVPGEFSSSDFVKRTVGVDNVCERAACASGGELVLGKQAGGGITVAIACVKEGQPL
ncbi:MAG: cobalt-precorrin 5A hydrolase [Eggerthellaceae bacterium]|nr:cobalt-precorrin 5A hydrolase [Eggerthellaceae bacterium]